ncbi:mechanosensitive ion channel family protein [Gimesia aquarii]|uniref:Small-conductance mechanosensitive channel n=1 Tax=Gimesia aquarii TaxID=2527964 RepID=A0A517WX10_9PLAN|nr:mechanosensitive ion channel family protein [Gimesia aquarii]QDU09801.1 Small-conductance mechanosensitive channel [Gimesia aquarii]
MPYLNGLLIIFVVIGGIATDSTAQDDVPSEPQKVKPLDDNETLEAPKSVNVTPAAEDSDISLRLTRILEVTEWYYQPSVRVDEGVAFLSGSTDDIKYYTWAGDLARSTQDVVAVVNRIEVKEPDIWDFSSSFLSLQKLGRNLAQSIPMILIAGVILLLTLFGMFLTGLIADLTLLKRIKNRLLRSVLRKGLLMIVLLFGVYLILQVSGLTRLAATVIGGTGLLGLIIGIAFRDIAENFLASVLISMQNPFRYGDLIEVEGIQGFVQRVNTRGTLLMSLEGNHIQIPNATIYKSVIHNYTSNPKVRLDFMIGVGYDVALSEAQSIAKDIMLDHPAVLNDPEPTVLIEELASSTVNLRMFCWIDGSKYSHLKVNSALMRQVKATFEEQGISMPDDAREVVFPDAVPVRMLDANDEVEHQEVSRQKAVTEQTSKSQTDILDSSGEGDLMNEYVDIKRQSQQARDPEEDSTDLLSPALT